MKSLFASIVTVTALVSTATFSATAATTAAFAPEELAAELLDKAACTGFEERYWDDLFAQHQMKKDFPEPKAYKQALIKLLASNGIDTQVDPADAFVDSAYALYFHINVVVPRLFAKETSQEVLAAMASIDQSQMTAAEIDDLKEDLTRQKVLETVKSFEMGNRSSLELEQLQDRVAVLLRQMNDKAGELGLGCHAPGLASSRRLDRPETVPLFNSWRLKYSPAVFGIRKTITVAYQSCRITETSGKLLTRQTPPIKGFAKTGVKFPDGIGEVRKISDLKSVVRSHPYIKTSVSPEEADAIKNKTCADLRVKPVLYSYGSRPSASPDSQSKLNLFQPTLKSVAFLGTDCSGFVATSLAAGGLKFRKKGSLKAMDIYGITSSSLVNPPRNGLDCFEPATLTAAAPIRAGDIIAGQGHVVIVESVGRDAFGIQKAIAAGKIKKATDCVARNLSTENFNFIVAQSAPVANGVGISRMHAREYFSRDGKFMGTPLLDHVAKACKASFSGPQTTVPGAIGISRHIGYNPDRTVRTPECVDAPVALEKEECLAICE